MRIMITGAKGFIGSYLSAYFREVGHQVFECGRDKLDLLDANAVKQFFNSTYFDLVINCALVGREDINTINDAIVKDNLTIWDNLVRNRHRFKRLINFGTGHEFDITNSIDYAEELDIFNAEPKNSYGYVKNMIAKDIPQYEEFYNLRLFGVFHYTESPKRFFRKLHGHSKRDFHITQDRPFDFINLEDIPPMVDVIMNGQAKHRDINMVYKDKLNLSEMAQMFNAITMSQANIIVDDPNGLPYTGDSRKFESYSTFKMGLPLGFLRY